jgi:hypothetical protein
VNSQKLGAAQRSYKVMKCLNILKKTVDYVKRKEKAFEKISIIKKKIVYLKKTGAIKRPLYGIIL